MPKKITTKKFASNVVLSIVAQIISMAVSFVLTLIVPKYIDESQYAHWQTFVLYVSYVGVLHFGLLDGLVLRYSKYDYDELDKPKLRSQLVVLLLFTSIISMIGVTVSVCAVSGANKSIIILVAIGVITKNLFTYGSYLFQITNRISKYVFITIAQRLSYGIFVVCLLVLKVNDFYWYCLAELAGDAIGILIGIIYNRDLVFGKSRLNRDALKEVKANVSSGIILMLANWSAMLMIGSAKMIIQWQWGDLVFGKVAFAFSVSNVFLVFVTAISVVLFPSLQRVDPEKLPSMYKSIRGILSPLLFFIMLFYFVGCWILKKWLPNYSESLTYLGVLLPIIIYSSKVSLLTNNYLKVYRKEKQMLSANVISILLGMCLFLISVFEYDNLYLLLGCVVFVLMFNSIISEIYVLKIIKIKIFKEFFIETAMTVGFIICACKFRLLIGAALYAGLLVVYGTLNFQSIAAFVKKFSSKLKGRKKIAQEGEG